MSCPGCGGVSEFEGYRKVTQVRTLVGDIVYERAYYSCKECHHGHCPTDQELHLEDKQTPGFREVLTLVGVKEAFADAAEHQLSRLSGVRASASTVRRVTEVVGEMISQVREAGGPLQEEPRVWDWHLDAEGRKVAYMSADMTSVSQQGPRGEKRAGRMPLVGALFNPASRTETTRRNKEIHDVHYNSGLMPLAELSQQFKTESQVVGLGQADIMIGMTDGGAGLEDCILDAVAGLSRETVFILDIHHVHEHLVEFAQVFCPESARKAQVSAWSTTLKERGGPPLLQELEALDLSGRTASVIEVHRQLLGDFRHNLHRMDYPRYIKNGWQIGSGVIESACKRVIGHRLKCGGMRWREPGTNALSHARSLYLSSDHRWEFFWSHVACG